MIKILQVNKFYYPKIGGIEKIVQQISEEMNKDSTFKVDVLCCGKKGEEKTVNGVRVIFAKMFFSFLGMPISLDFFRRFRKLRNEYDILDFHHPFPLEDIALFLFPAHSKVVVHYHSDIVRQKFLRIFVFPFILNTLRKAKKIIVSNPNLIETSPVLKRFKDKCVVIPFGVEFQKFQRVDFKKVAEIKKKYGRFVLFVGRLSYYKGVEYLIKAMKSISANLVIIGDGSEKEKLKNLTERLKIKSKVFFLPFQPDKKLVEFYHACSVFVLPSIFRSEAFGIVLIEAMACGKPVISTDLGTGTSWVNEDGKTGFVVESRNVSDLEKSIKKILEDDKLSEKFRKNSFERVNKFFRIEKMIEKLKTIYLSL